MCEAMTKNGFEIKNNVSIPRADRQEVDKYLNSLVERDSNRFTLSNGKSSKFKNLNIAVKKLFKKLVGNTID